MDGGGGRGAVAADLPPSAAAFDFAALPPFSFFFFFLEEEDEEGEGPTPCGAGLPQPRTSGGAGDDANDDDDEDEDDGTGVSSSGSRLRLHSASPAARDPFAACAYAHTSAGTREAPVKCTLDASSDAIDSTVAGCRLASAANITR